MPSPALGPPGTCSSDCAGALAGPEAAQKKLDSIVTHIASNMVAEVCSLYVMRPGGITWSFLPPKACGARTVRQSKLKVGEGLVGTIAARERSLLSTFRAPDAHP